jgi:MFS family permease
MAVGRVADMVGHKLLYTYGFMVFIVGSALCGLAPSLGFLDGFRVLQAVGAAMLQANSVAIIALAMPPERLGRAIGIQGTAQALGLAFGPTVGGLLIALGGWRLIFFVNVPVGVIASLLAWFLIPRSRHLQRVTSFDWAGLGLFVPAVATLLLAITSLADGHGGCPQRSPACWRGAPSCVASSCSVSGGHAPPGSISAWSAGWRSPPASPAASSYLVMSGALYAVALYLEGEPRHPSPGITGLELSVMPLAFGVVAPSAGRAALWLDARIPTVVGILLEAASLGVLPSSTRQEPSSSHSPA